MSDSSREVTVAMPLVDVLPCSDGADWVCCLGCGSPLDAHQPETSAPSRLLGTCDACGRWYLLDWRPGDDAGLMLLLPDPPTLRTLASG